MSKNAARKTGSKAKQELIMCLAPDVCLTPAGSAKVPIPYMIIATLDDATDTASKIKFGGDEAFTMNARITKCTGDEPGSSGGVVSGVNKGWSKPVTNKNSLKIGPDEVLMHDCVFDMNCDGKEGTGNTKGKLSIQY